MLWIALTFPHLPLDACRGGADACIPHAIVRQHRIACLDTAAEAAGIRVGQKRANALAICPTLHLIERNEMRERALLDATALALMRFTPSISVAHSTPGSWRDPTAGLLLEVQGSLRLFNGLATLIHAIRFTLAELDLHASLAVFPTATGAWLLAQCPETPSDDIAADVDPLQRLDVVPVDVLDTAQPHLDALTGIGATRLRELRLLPRDGLARRFGHALLNEIDRAYGEAPDPRPWLQAPAEFHARLELFARVDHAEALLFAARRLLLQLVGWLGARHAALREFTLELEHEFYKSADRRCSVMTISLASPTRDAEHLTVLLREHLARTTLAAPVLEIALHAAHIEPLAAPTTELFPTPANETEGLARLIERLGARLGTDAIQCITLVEDHRPEAAQRMTAYCGDVRTTQSAPVSAADPPRPAWLLRNPLRLPVHNHRPVHQGPLRLVAGPERIEAGWWNRTACRDYFIAENEAAELLWIYRERLTGGDEHWYLQGRFG